MDENVVRIRVGMAVSYIHNSKHEAVMEYPRDEWEAMTPKQREATLNEMADSYVADYLEAWAEVEEA